MNYEEFKNLKVGDKVKIVDKYEGLFDFAVSMREYLGKVMTITDVQTNETIESRHWYVNLKSTYYAWYPDAIERVVEKKMTENMFKNLKPGDKVRIASERTKRKNGNCLWNREGAMDQYFGKVVTVKQLSSYYPGDAIRIEEDGCHWVWYLEMIDTLIVDQNKEELRTQTNQQIVIKTEGNTVTAYCGKNKGVAKCSPKDKFDLYIGAKLALDRLFEKEEKKERNRKRG